MMISTRRNTYKWPNWRVPSLNPPGQPYPGFLKERREAIKCICKARREHKRAMRAADRQAHRENAERVHQEIINE